MAGGRSAAEADDPAVKIADGGGDGCSLVAGSDMAGRVWVLLMAVGWHGRGPRAVER